MRVELRNNTYDEKRDAAVIQASEELGELGAVAAGAALKLA